MRHAKTILVIALACYALPVLGYIVLGTLGKHGANDFHQYWYAGQFFLAGQDPYQAFFSGTSLPMRQPGLEITPSNSPALMLVLSLLSLLPWFAAKVLWLLLNLLFACLSFWLVAKKMSYPGVSLDRQTNTIIFLLFFNLSATRIAIENGQTTLMVVVLMLAAITLTKRSWVLAGLFLGLALSKYSVSLPVVLFLLYQRELRVLGTAFLVQFFGFVGVAMLSGNPLFFVIEEYWQLSLRLKDQSGIHLASLIHGRSLDDTLPALIGIALVVSLITWLLRRRPMRAVNTAILDFHLVTILAIWSLLIGYHRLYDSLVLLLFIVLVFKSFQRPDVWNLAPWMRTAVASGLGIGLFLLTIPARLVGKFLPGMYDLLSYDIPTVTLLVFICAAMGLLHRFLFPPMMER